jgi:hypothetical protein
MCRWCVDNHYDNWFDTNIAFCGGCGYQVCKTCFQRNNGVSEKHRDSAKGNGDPEPCYLDFESSGM